MAIKGNNISFGRIASIMKARILYRLEGEVDERKLNKIARKTGMMILYEIVPGDFLSKFIRKKHPQFANDTVFTSSEFKRYWRKYEAILIGVVDNEVIQKEFWDYYRYLKGYEYIKKWRKAKKVRLKKEKKIKIT